MRLAIALLAASIAGQGLTQSYEVTGVAENDTLNLRAEVYAHDNFAAAPVMGDAAHDATGLRATGRSYVLDGQVWRELYHEGDKAWANAAFLRQTSLWPDAAEFSCAGTEPFWDISFGEATGTLGAIDRPTVSIETTDWIAAAGRRDVRRYDLSVPAEGREMTAIVAHTQSCSDGMSDFDYAYSLYLSGMEPGALHAGCCTVK